MEPTLHHLPNMLHPKNILPLIGLAFLPFFMSAQTDSIEEEEVFFCPPADLVESQTPGMTLWTDQDVFSRFNEDRNYTMGLGFRFAGKRVNKPLWLAPLGRQVIDNWVLERPIKRAIRKGKLWQDCELTQDALDFFVTGFTPLDIANKAVVVGDRPYACLLGLGSTRGRSFNNNDVFSKRMFISSSFYIGVLGTHIGKAVQSYIHRNHWMGSTRPEPEGWSNQISDGGELTFMYRWGITKPLLEWDTKPKDPSKRPTHLFQYSATAELYAGYYTQASVSLNFRFGFFDHYYFQAADTYSSASNSGVNNQRRSKLRAYFFFQPRARFVLYNGLLQGQFAPSAYTLGFNEISHAIFDWNWGITASYWRFDLVYIPDAGRTAEFKSPLARNHRWATIYLKYNF